MMYFIWEVRHFGFKIAFSNLLLDIFKKVSGAKRITITYSKKRWPK